MLAFDTDMIGPYGYCADLSRSWTIDHVPMTGEQRAIYGAALEQIEHNVALIEPGHGLSRIHGAELADPRPVSGLPLLVPASRRRPGRRVPGRLRPAATPPTSRQGGSSPGMVLCAESLIAEQGGREAVKLETQVLVTETGAERLDSFPLRRVGY